nr:hypothetical protein [uncultured Chryseobacterium sp.]
MHEIDIFIFSNTTSDYVNIKSDRKVKNIVIYSYDGKNVNEARDSKIDLAFYP